MLQAGWDLYEGEYFAARTRISAKELDYLIRRLSQAGFAASGLTGFSFDAFVKIDIDTEMTDELEKQGCIWLESVFYICLSLTISFGVFSIVLSVLSVMKAQRMALHGNIDFSVIQQELPETLGGAIGAIGDGYAHCGDFAASAEQRARSLSQSQQLKENDDMQKAIFALRKLQPVVLGSLALSLGFFVAAAVAMCWVKTVYKHDEGVPFNVTAVTLTTIIACLGVSVGGSFSWMNRLFQLGTFHESGLHRRAVVPPRHGPAQPRYSQRAGPAPAPAAHNS